MLRPSTAGCSHRAQTAVLAADESCTATGKTSRGQTRWSSLAKIGLVLGLAGFAAGGCKHSERGALVAPAGAADWQAHLQPAFDDGVTATPVRLTGRAPNDVKDQRLFGVRLGCADIVMLGTVEHVWDRQLHQGRPVQQIDVTLGEVLLGHLDKRVSKDQSLRVEVTDPLEGELQTRQVMLFLRWAPGQQPEYHHHLILVEPELLAGVQAQIRHAEQAGKLPKKPKKRRRRSKRRKKASSTGARCGYDEVRDIVEAQALVEAPEEEPDKQGEPGEGAKDAAKKPDKAPDSPKASETKRP